MNFDFSDDQKLLKDQAQKFLQDRCSAAEVRKVLDNDDVPYHKDLWNEMGQMGWLGTAIPEEFGGSGFGYLELCVVAEEMGRAVAPVPFSSSVYLAAEGLMIAGSQSQKEQWLPRIASGEAIGTIAVAEGPRPATAANLQVNADGGKVSGEKTPVVDGDIADFALVLAKGGKGASLYCVDLNGDGVSRETVPTIDPTRSHAKVTFNDAKGELVGDEGQGWEIYDQIRDRAAILFAFEQVGGAQASMDMAREYAMGRYAFGRPIASFQAIKHKLADMYVATELARSNSYYGAWALSTNAAELPVAAAGARVSATDAFHFCSKENIQTHGGMGFTWEFDCHLYYRRSKLLALNIGAQREWKDRLISHLEKRNVA